MGKKQEITQDLIKRAREVYREINSKNGIFYKKNLRTLRPSERKNLVGMLYSDIHGIPISELPINQIHAISYEIPFRVKEIVFEYGRNEEEGKIFQKIKNLKSSTSDYEKEKLLEELSIQLEDSICTSVSGALNNVIYDLYGSYSEKDIPF